MFPNAPEFGPETRRGGDPSGLGVGVSISLEQFAQKVDIFGSPQAAAGMTQRNNQPVRVRSVQEAKKLPSGTLILTPDGQQRVTR